MKKTILVLMAVTGWIAGTSLRAQTTDIQILGVELQLAGAGSAAQPTDTFEVNVMLFVADTVNTAKLHVVMTNNSGRHTFISRVFDFDVAAGATRYNGAPRLTLPQFIRLARLLLLR
jgi:hypothetical protein